MRNLSLISVLAILFLFSGCMKDDCTRTVTHIQSEPVYMQPEEFRNGIQWEDSRSLENPGKIYVYEHYLLVNEMRKGIHVYDNTNPASPNKIGFLNIPGNMDMAVKNGYLYADNATDLISIDLRSGIQQAEVIDREESAFPAYHEDPEKGLLIYHKTQEVTKEVPCGESIDQQPNNWPWLRFGVLAEGGFSFDNNWSIGNNDYGGNKGQGGSMARFSLMKDHLYVIDDQSMRTFSTAENGQLEFRSDVTVQWGIETLFGYGDYLFIGANDGMHIMDNTNPGDPTYLASYNHANACDPVFVSGDYAYVTLRDGTDCQNFTNQLDVVNISDIDDPQLKKSFDMEHPHGLSVASDKLYLCEGRHGMKSFNASNPLKVGDELLHHKKGFDAFDVIVNSKTNMIVTGQDGIRQFSIDPENGQFQEISIIQVQ